MEEKMHRHFKIYKPYGFLSQFLTRQKTRKNKKLLGTLYDFPPGAMSVGRLDEDSEGLLLITTDGKLSARITGSTVEKEYYVQVDGEIGSAALHELQRGVEIGINGTKYLTKPCKAFLVESTPGFPPRAKKIRDARHGPTSWISVTLTEGKFRQVRKMTAAVGFPTLRLVRVRIANETIESFDAGEVRQVPSFEI